MNPYQSPAAFGVQPHFALPGEIRPTRIDFSETLSRTWTVFVDQWLAVLGGLFLIMIVSIIPAIAVMLVFPGIAAAVGNPILAFVVTAVFQIAFQIYGLWIGIGFQLFMLGVVRGEEPEYGRIFSGGRYLLPIILCAILTTLVVMAGLILLIIPGIVFAFMLLQAQLLIIDRNLDVIDAMSTSRVVMAGNKLTVFALIFVTAILGSIFCSVTCGLGAFAYVPYAIILNFVIYLGVTGQPTMADHYMMPAGQLGGTPIGQPTPGAPQSDSPFMS